MGDPRRRAKKASAAPQTRQASSIGFFGLPSASPTERDGGAGDSGRGGKAKARRRGVGPLPPRSASNGRDDAFDLSLSDLAMREERREKAKRVGRKQPLLMAAAVGSEEEVAPRRRVTSRPKGDGKEERNANEAADRKKRKRQLGMHSFLASSSASSSSAASERKILHRQLSVPLEDRGIPSPAFPTAPRATSLPIQGSTVQERNNTPLHINGSGTCAHPKGPGKPENSDNGIPDVVAVSPESVCTASTSTENDQSDIDSKGDGSRLPPSLQHADVSHSIQGKEEIEKSIEERFEGQRKRLEIQRRKQRNLLMFAERSLLSPLGSHQSADDDEVNEDDAPKPCYSVTSELLRRTVYQSRNRVGPSSALQRFAHGKNWVANDTVELESTHIGATLCMDFDSQGILLATADTQGAISVYDFDEVNAADSRIRNFRCRQEANLNRARSEAEDGDPVPQEGGNENHHPQNIVTFSDDVVSDQSLERAVVRPIVSFFARLKPTSLPGSLQVTSIKWNPYAEDELAVAFLTQPEVCVYDVASCSSATSHPQSIRLADGQLRRGQHRGEGTWSVIFLRSRQNSVSRIMTGGTRGTIRLWTTLSFSHGLAQQVMQQKVKLLWAISPFHSLDAVDGDSAQEGEGISDIIPAHDGVLHSGTELIMVTGTKGSIALLDIKKCTRKAFSTSVTPTVLHCWNVHRIAVEHHLVTNSKLPPRKWMGIKKASLWSNGMVPVTSRPFLSESRSMLHATFVTNCGWVLEASVDVLAKTMKIKIVHKTKQVLYLNIDREKVENIPSSLLPYSLPRRPTPSCLFHGSASLLCLMDVQQQQVVLGGKDKRILDAASVPNEHDTDDHRDGIIILGDRQGPHEQLSDADRRPVIAEIPISDLPRSLIVHPGSEWIITGGEGAAKAQLLRIRR